MRILIATDAWPPQVNGVVTTLTEVIGDLRQRGHEVHVIDYSQFRSLAYPGYPEFRLAIGCYKEIRRRLIDWQPDAVHIATECPVGLATRKACLNLGLSFTTSYHTRFPEYLKARLPVPLRLSYAFMRWFHSPSKCVMVATPSLKQGLEARGFKNLALWSRGVDLERFRPDLEPLFGDLQKPVMACVGRVSVEKNIEAFLKLNLKGTKVVIGDGPQLAHLKKTYPQAVFTGALFGEKLAKAYAGSDVLVFPSLTDTFGLVMLEAMATGTPVAAFPAPGPMDILPESGAGVIDADLSKAIDAALKLDRKAVRKYAETYSWADCTKTFLQHLHPRG